MPEEKEEEANTDSVVLEEEIDPNYVPGDDEVVEYAKWLGMDLEKDKDLYWIAREGLMAPLPKNWKPCKTKDTEDIYYFNFLTGESTWDHPCDGYYKRLYEEEKKKKEVSLKESADAKRAKAKQDVQDLLGKDKESSKKAKKKSKKKTSLNAIGPGGLKEPGKGLSKFGEVPALGAKPLPNILGKSLDVPPLKSLAASDKPAISSSLSSLSEAKGQAVEAGNEFETQKSRSKQQVLSSEEKSDIRQLESKPGTQDLDSKASSSLTAPKPCDSPAMFAEKKPSRFSNRIQDARKSESEECSSGDFGLMSRRDSISSPDDPKATPHQSLVEDSPLPSSVNMRLHFGDDSKTEVDFVRHQYSQHDEDQHERRSNFVSEAGNSHESDKERIALRTERETLEMQRQQFKLEKERFEQEKATMEKERSLLSTERASLRRERSETESLRDELARDRDAFQRQQSREKSLHSGRESGAWEEEVRKLERELEEKGREMDALRRERNELSADMLKMEKSLESEKNLRSASLREASQNASSTQKELDDALRKLALMEVDQRSQNDQVERLNKKLSVLSQEKSDAEEEAATLKQRLHEAVSSTNGDRDKTRENYLEESLKETELSIEKQSEEIKRLKLSISNLEMQVIDANNEAQKSRVKLGISTDETSRLEQELGEAQSEKRKLKRAQEDLEDEMSRLTRDCEALKRREAQALEEVDILKASRDEAQRLDVQLQKEKAKCRRIESEKESLQHELDMSKTQIRNLQEEVSQVSARDAQHTTQVRTLQDKLDQMHLRGHRDDDKNEDKHSLEVDDLNHQISELTNKLMAANSCRVDQANLLDQSEAKREELEARVASYEQSISRLEQQVAQLSESKSSARSSPLTVKTAAAAPGGVSELEVKLSRLEKKLQEAEVDRDAAESRVKTAKLRANELQEQLDSLEADVASSRSEVKKKSKEMESLQEAMSGLEREVRNEKEKVSSLIEDKRLLERREQELQVSLKRKSDEKHEMEMEKDSITHLRQKDMTNHATIVRDLEHQIKQLKERVADESSRKSSSNEDNTIEMNMFKESLEQEKMRSRQLQDKVDLLSSQMASKGAEVSELSQQSAETSRNDRQELQKERQQNQSLQSQLSDLEFRLRRSEQNSEELKMQLSESSDKRRADGETLKGYQEEILHLQQRIHSLEKSAACGSVENISLEGRPARQSDEELLQQIRRLQTSLEKQHELNAALTQEIHNMKSSNLSLTNQLEEAKFQIKIKAQSLQNSEQRSDSFEEEVKKMKQERQRLVAEAIDARHEISSLTAQLSNAEAERESAALSAESYSRDVSRLRGELQATQLKLSAVERQALSLSEGSGQASPPANNSIDHKLEESRGLHELMSSPSPSLVQSLRQETERLQSELSKAKSELSAARKKLLEEQHESSALRDRLTTAELEASGLRQQLNLKQEEISRLFEMNSNNQKAIRMLDSSSEKQNAYTSPASFSSSGPATKLSNSSMLRQKVDGHEEKISELQLHKQEWQNALTQQNEIVRRLEEKLSDTEKALNVYIHRQQPEFQPLAPGSPRQELRPVGADTSRPQKEASATPRLREEFISSLKGFNELMNAQLEDPEDFAAAWGGVESPEQGVEIDHRYQDLTFEENSLSGDEGDGDFNRRKEESQSPSALTVLKEVLVNLMHSQSELRDSKARGSAPSRSSRRHEDWKQKIRKEKTFIVNVKKALKLENEYVKQVQESLSKHRDSWKMKREKLKRTPQAVRGDLAELEHAKEALKREGDRLNTRTTQLNDLVHQIRRTQGWVAAREKKITQLEKLAASRSRGAEQGEWATGGSLDSHLSKMRSLEQELEKDLTALGDDTLTPLTTFNAYDTGSSEEDRGSGREDKWARRDESRERRGRRLRFEADGETAAGSSGHQTLRDRDAINDLFPKELPYSNAHKSQVSKSGWQQNENVPNRNVAIPFRAYSSFGTARSSARSLVERQLKSADAYDSHVSWLDTLRKEISHFPHSSSVESDVARSTRDYKVHITSNNDSKGSDVHGLNEVYRV